VPAPLRPTWWLPRAAVVVAVLRLPLSAVVLAVLLTAKSGPGAAPLVIAGVVVAYLTTVVLAGWRADGPPRREAARRREA
jgi:hypothetical protein